MTKGSRTQSVKKKKPQHPWEPNDIVTFNVPIDKVVTRLLDVRFHTFSVVQRYALIDAITAALQKVMSPEFAELQQKKKKKKGKKK